MATAMLRAIGRHLVGDGASSVPAAAADSDSELQLAAAAASASPWHAEPLFKAGSCDHGLSGAQLETLNLDGHVVLPGVLTPETVQRTIHALQQIEELEQQWEATPEGRRKAEIQSQLQAPDLETSTRESLLRELNTWSEDGGHGLRMGIRQVVAEHNEYLESILGHPDMLALAKSVLGPEIRFDHCCDSSGRQPGNTGMGYHSHP